MQKVPGMADLPIGEDRSMSTVCPKCAYIRGADEVVPDSECPRCGVIYEKYRTAIARREKEEADAVAAAGQAGPDGAGVGNLPGSNPEAPPAPGGPAAVTGQEVPVGVSAPTAPTPWLRYLGLAAAFMLLVGVIALSTREHRGDPGKDTGPAGFAGVYEGSATREIPLNSGRPYEAAYDARFTVGQDGRITEIAWTDGSYLLDRATVSWSAPAQTEYTIVIREDYTLSFEDPPRGEYSRFTRDGSSFRAEAVHPRSADLQRFEYSGEVPPEVAARETVTDGLLRPSKQEKGAYQAVIHPGLPRMGRRDVAPGDVTCGLAESAANRALQPYLAGVKSLPGGAAIDLEASVDGVDIENVMVPRWPGRLWVSLYGVRVNPASGTLDDGSRGAEGRRPRVELGDSCRIALDFFDPIGWEIRVVFLPDGRIVARIPARNIEIPVTKVAEVAAAED
jgi:hypothetical protein